MKKFTLIILVAAAAVVSGCQDKAESISQRQARLVASQNIELKQQLLEKDEQIENLQAELAECNGQIDALKKTSEDAAGNMMEMIKATTEGLAKQNAELREKVKELEARLAEKSDE